MSKGKTTFVKNVLCSYAQESGERVYLLEPRSAVRQQQYNDTQGIPNITVGIYQTNVQDAYRNKDEQQLKQLQESKFIVCDEYHYFTSDAWNGYTDDAFDFIFNGTPQAIKVLMSATDVDVRGYLDFKNILYHPYPFPTNYDGAHKISTFENWDTVDDFITDGLRHGIKTVVFAEKANQAYNLYNRYKSVSKSIFATSVPNGEKHQAFMAKENQGLYQDMLLNAKFDADILFTTLKMEVGVNLKDRSIKQIIVAVNDVYSIKQCLGRKRKLDESDTVEVFVYVPDRRTLRGSYDRTREQIETYNVHSANKCSLSAYVMNHGKTYQNETGGIIYIGEGEQNSYDEDGQLVPKVNELLLHSKRCKVERLNKILYSYGCVADGYRAILADTLQSNIPISKCFEHRRLKDFLCECYEKSIIFCTKAEKSSLSGQIGCRLNGRCAKGITNLNNYLKDIFKGEYVQYRIQVVNNYYKDGKRYKVAWQVVQEKRK